MCEPVCRCKSNKRKQESDGTRTRSGRQGAHGSPSTRSANENPRNKKPATIRQVTPPLIGSKFDLVFQLCSSSGVWLQCPVSFHERFCLEIAEDSGRPAGKQGEEPVYWVVGGNEGKILLSSSLLTRHRLGTAQVSA